MFPNTSLDFISDMKLTDYKHYDPIIQKIKQRIFDFKKSPKKQVFFEVSYYASKIYELEKVTSGLCYNEQLIFLENNML